MAPFSLRCVVLVSALAGLARHIDAARVQGVTTATGVAAPTLSTARFQPVDWAERDRDLRLSAAYVDAVNVDEPMSRSKMLDILDHLEDLRTRVFGIGTFRDARSREEVRRVLGEIKKKSDALSRLSEQKRAQGEADDGGDLFPTERDDNICNEIYHYEVDAEFRDGVRRFCNSLDALRGAVLAGESLEDAVLEVCEWLTALRLRLQPPYAQKYISSGIASVLGDERRWVTKQVSQTSATPGAFEEDVILAGLLNSWKTDVIPSVGEDPVLWERSLQESYNIAQDAQVEGHLSLSVLRANLHRLEIGKERLTELVIDSDPAGREGIREILHMMKDKVAALRTLIEEKEAAGERDDGGETLPTQRDNICKNLEEFSLDRDVHEDVQHICQSLDKLRKVVLERSADKDAAVMDVVGRMRSLESRPGYNDMPIAGEIEHVLAEEWRWLTKREQGAGEEQ